MQYLSIARSLVSDLFGKRRMFVAVVVFACAVMGLGAASVLASELQSGSVVSPFACLPNDLTTTFAGGNEQAGNMFDITATNTVTINSFDGNLFHDGFIQIYYKAGTHTGFEVDPGAWTSLGTSSFIIANGSGVPTAIPLPVNVTIPAGETYGFYITYNAVDRRMFYTNGTVLGNVFVSDANIQIKEGVGKAYPFADTFYVRIWNGVVHYTSGDDCATATPTNTPTNTPTAVFTATPGDMTCIPTDRPTVFSGVNSNNGNMFDITALNTVRIDSFDENLTNNEPMAIYYKVGTHEGFQNDPGPWILVGTAPAVVSNGAGNPSPVPIPVNITIPAGQTYAFYITYTTGQGSLNYSVGTARGNVFVSDGNIQVKEGTGVSYPFFNNFFPRVFNGIVHYTPGADCPADVATDTPTNTPTSTATNTPTATATSTFTPTAMDTATATATVTNTATNTPTATSTFTPTASNTATATSTATNTPTRTATSTSTPTATNTATATATATNTATRTSTPTATATATNTATNTPTATNTATRTATNTPTNTPVFTASSTATNTPTSMPSPSPTCTTGQLYDNGPLVTNPTGGFGGAPLSALQTSLGANVYGFSAAATTTNRVADDFMVPAGGWTINALTLYGYQTGSSTTSTFNLARVQIWNSSGVVVFGDMTTNRFASTSFTGAYRATDTAPTGNTRPIMAVVANIGVTLPAGTYWIDFQLGGTGAVGPFIPQVTLPGQLNKPGSNGLQFIGAWIYLADNGAVQDVPFKINGSTTCGTATPTATSTTTKTPTSTPTYTPTVIPSNTPTRTPTNTPTVVPSGTPTRTATATPTSTASPACTPVTTKTFAGTGTGAIPDGLAGTPPQYGAPLVISFPVTGMRGPITSLSTNLTLTHSFVGDLDMVLTSPGGVSSFVTVSRIGVTAAGSYGDSSDFCGLYNFTDTAIGTNIWTIAAGLGNIGNIPPGDYRTTAPGGPGQSNPAPFTNLTAAFAGLTTAQINGTWTLRIRDAAACDIGSVTAANLVLKGAACQ